MDKRRPGRPLPMDATSRPAGAGVRASSSTLRLRRGHERYDAGCSWLRFRHQGCAVVVTAAGQRSSAPGQTSACWPPRPTRGREPSASSPTRPATGSRTPTGQLRQDLPGPSNGTSRGGYEGPGREHLSSIDDRRIGGSLTSCRCSGGLLSRHRR